MVGLTEIPQKDFAAGSQLSVARHLISSRGTYLVKNGLYDDDGSVYRRGGSQYKSNAAFGASLRWGADVIFPCGQRTVFASPTAFGVLDADDATPVSVGGAGLTEPVPYAVVGGIMFIGGGAMYAGSRKAANYGTGTVTTTQGSKVVTGAGTSWLANVDPGMLFRVDGSKYIPVASVDSNTQITLTEPWPSAGGAGIGYSLERIGSTANHGLPAAIQTAPIFVAVADRLVAIVGNKAFFSDGVDPGTSVAALVGSHRTFSWPTKNVHELGDGVTIIAGAVLGTRLLLFTTGGLYGISNMALEIVDAAGNQQHPIQQLSSDLIAWGSPGVASFANAVVVACTDGVYLLDGVSDPVPVGKSIWPRIVSYVRSGYKPGKPDVYKGHLFLPVLDASNAVIDFMVCRLDRPVRTGEGLSWAWSFFDGHGGNMCAVAVRAASGSQRLPDLIGFSRSGDAKVLKLGSFFEPSATVKNDADGTTHRCSLDTRDYRTSGQNGGAVRNLVRMARLRYILIDAASDDPKINAYYSTGSPNAAPPLWGVATWNDFTWPDPATAEYNLLSGQAPESDGRLPYVWAAEQGLRAHTEYVRYRFETSGPCALAKFLEVVTFARQSGKVV